MAVVAFLSCLFHVWIAFDVHPFTWKTPIDLCFGILALPIPMIIGLHFRKTLRNELYKDLLSERTYRICDRWISRLLLYVYMGFLLFQN